MNINKDYDRFLKRYCATRKISRAEAESHALVKEVKSQYEQKDDTTKVVGWKENDT